MFERELRFVTEKSDEVLTIDPFHLPNICITILAEHEARFIAVYDPKNGMKTIFTAHYNAETEAKEVYDRYTYCFFDGSKNRHLERYSSFN